MKKLLLITALFFQSIALSNVPPSGPRLFVMLEIDSVVIDTIPAVVQAAKQGAYVNELREAGYNIQEIEINTAHSKDHKLDKFLKKTNQQPVALNDSNREKIKEMVVIRPWIKYLLEEVTKFNIPTYFLICSRSGQERVQSLIKNLDLEINNINFKDIVQYVSQDNFIVHITNFDGNKIAAKSAFQLRSRYVGKHGKISLNDYVLLIDTLPDSQFILADRAHDLNVKLSPFYVKTVNNYNADYDQLDIKVALEKIKNLLKNR